MNSPYARFAAVLAVNSVIMFLLTYTLIDSWDHFYPNVNRVYRAILMVSSMAVLMMGLMWTMYPGRRVNLAIMGGAVVIFIAVFALTRDQSFVGNEQFLRSMIPHHSSAIVMCEHSSITDPAIVDLCGRIVETQEQEIAEMKEILGRY